MMGSNEMLQDIKNKLYLSDLSYPVLGETLTGAGELRAWYRASRKEAEHPNTFREVNWFLTDNVLLRQEINQREIFFVSFCLKEISRLERFYDIRREVAGGIVLRRIVITFNDSKGCDLSLPSQQFQGDIDGFIKLVSLLG